jgi:hypothetical protein
MRKKLVAGNWKMHGRHQAIEQGCISLKTAVHLPVPGDKLFTHMRINSVGKNLWIIAIRRGNGQD